MFSDLQQVQWEPASATKTCFMFWGFLLQAMGACFFKKLWATIKGLQRLAKVMIDPAMDRGGLKNSENAPNSFILKINQTVFWRLGTDVTFTRVTKVKELHRFGIGINDTFKTIISAFGWVRGTTLHSVAHTTTKGFVELFSLIRSYMIVFIILGKALRLLSHQSQLLLLSVL